MTPPVQVKTAGPTPPGQLKTAPSFPNIHASVGSTVPIVTTLLAGISAAVFVVPLSSGAASTKICVGPLVLSTPEAATILGALSTTLFVLATVYSVYSHAQNFDALPVDQQDAFLKEHGLKKRRKVVTDSYRRATLDWYLLAWFWWQVGLITLLLTIGLLAMPRVAWMGAAVPIAGIAVSALAVRHFGRWQRVVSLVAFLACVTFFFGAVNSLLGECA